MQTTSPVHVPEPGSRADPAEAAARSGPGAEAARPVRVLVPLGSPFLYGLERTVIELFDAVRPEVESEFILSQAGLLRRLPIYREVVSRGLPHRFFADARGWPRIDQARSLRGLVRLLAALASGNLTTLKAALGADALYVATFIDLHSVAAALYLRLRGRRVVFHLHDWRTEPQPLLRFWSWLATDFVHYTETTHRAVAQGNPWIDRRPNVAIPPVFPAAEVRERDALFPDVPGGRRRIVFVGQVARHKGVDLLLEAFAKVNREVDDVELHIVGGCKDEYREGFGTLMSLWGANVRTWGFRADAAQFYRGAYLYVHPSPPSRFHEAFGRGAAEAMAAGVPTVCFRSGALQEVVEHERTGLVCEESAGALAQAMTRLLRDPDLRDRCAADARQQFLTLYAPEKIRRRWIDFFRRQ